MAERFSEMENSSVPSKATLEERLKEYPELKAKIETLLGIIENAGGDIEKAAEAERRIIEELGQMGNEALHGWARRQQEKKEQEYNAKPGGDRKSTRLNSSHGYISYAAFSLKKKSFSSLDDYAAGRPYSFTQQAGDGHAAFLEKVVDLFAPDEIRLRANLSLDLRLRYDWQSH